MSRRNNDGMAAFGCLALIFAPFVFGYLKIKEMLTVPADAKLRNMDRPQGWGGKTEEVICSNCGAGNESGRHNCYACNNPLPFKEKAPLPNRPEIPAEKLLGGPLVAYEKVLLSVAAIIALFLLIYFMMY